MDILKIIASLVEEYDCSTRINADRGYITFSKNVPKKRLRGAPDSMYRITIKNMNADIIKVDVTPGTTSGRSFFIPDSTKLLSVDLHDPRSLDAIRDYLKTL